MEIVRSVNPDKTNLNFYEDSLTLNFCNTCNNVLWTD